MMTLDKKYRDELTLALRLHEISGDRVGEVLAEVETHISETGEDPVVAFGSPREYAAQVAGHIEVGRGKRSTAEILSGALVTGALTFIGADLLFGGLFADGPIPVRALDLVVWLLMPGVVAGAIFVLFRGVTAVSNGRTYTVAGIGLIAMVMVGSAVVGASDGGESLVELPPALGTGIGAVLLIGAGIILFFVTKRGRIVDPRQG